MIVGVLVQLSNKNIDKIFDYKVKDELLDKIKIGIRVEVPFGHQTLEGFVLEIKKESSTDLELKEIISIIDDDVILNDELLELGKKIQEKTLSTLISCYQVMLPKALKAKKGTNINKKYDTYYKLGDSSNYKLNKTQEAIISLFKDKDLVKREDILKISISSLNTLIKKNVLIPVKLEKYRMSYKEKSNNKHKLTNDQKSVVEEFNKYKGYNTFLLHGVTGSGKT
ncbi:MAG: hypothetical protein IJ880_02930, partial [Bacilli bacterium]|nr:hypothetical protein [Bacilli bacterium]